MRAASAKLASVDEQSLGAASVEGCKGGLLLPGTGTTIASLRTSLSQRIDAKKYVACVYLGVMALIFAYVLIHASHISRLGRETAELLEKRSDPQQPRPE